jgi:IS30 family transposase
MSYTHLTPLERNQLYKMRTIEVFQEVKMEFRRTITFDNGTKIF